MGAVGLLASAHRTTGTTTTGTTTASTATSTTSSAAAGVSDEAADDSADDTADALLKAIGGCEYSLDLLEALDGFTESELTRQIAETQVRVCR